MLCLKPGLPRGCKVSRAAVASNSFSALSQSHRIHREAIMSLFSKSDSETIYCQALKESFTVPGIWCLLQTEIK